MSAEATGWVWKNWPREEGGSSAQLVVTLAIADVVNDAHGNEFWMSTYGLASKARVARSTVIATLNKLVNDGWLEVVQPGENLRKPTRYRWTASAVIGLASATTGLALDRSSVANSIRTKSNNPSEASAVIGLVPDARCVTCRGTGSHYHPGAGRDAPCACTKPIYPTESSRKLRAAE